MSILVTLQQSVRDLSVKLKESIFFQNILLITGGSVLAKSLGIIVTPIITRIYSTADYGIFSVFTSIVGIVGSIATLRYAVAIPIAKKENLADDVFNLSIIVTFILSLLISIVVILFGDYLTDKYSVTHISKYLWIVPLAFFGYGIYFSLLNWATRHKKFKSISGTIITREISSKSLSIGLGLLGFKPVGLLIGIIANQGAGIGNLLRVFIKEKRNTSYRISYRRICSAAKRYKKFPIFQSWSQLLLSLGANLPLLLIAAYYGAEVAGLFGLAQGMISMPIRIIGNSVSSVYYAEIAEIGASNPGRIYILTISIIKKLFIIGTIPMTFILILGPWLFSILFGSEWAEAGEYARLLVFIILTRFVSSPIMQSLNVFEKLGLQAGINIFRILIIGAIFFVAKSYDWSATKTISLYSISLTLFYFAIIFIVINLLRSLKKGIHE